MAGEIEAAGGLVTGSLIAQAFEAPAAGTSVVKPDAGAHGACANCGAPLHGHFCSHCGQHAVVHRSIGHIGEELLHGLTHFEGKAWRTLPALAFAPGRLTRDYVYGKRARYIAPMAMFLFAVFLMFFVFGFVGANGIIDTDVPVAAGTPAEQLTAARQAVDEARNAAAKTAADPKATAAERATTQFALAATTRALALAEPAATAGPAAPHQSWQDWLREQGRNGKIKVDTGIASVDANVRQALENPDFAFYRVQQKAYKLSFLLVPLSVPVLWLMFCWRRDVLSFDHVVFLLYSLSFMSLLVILAALLAAAGRVVPAVGGVAGLLFFIPPVHMFFQLKGAYQLTSGGALWRTAVLSVAAVITLAMFGALIVVAGLAD